ncbi:MAG: hypothetical protein B6244_05310 [Candidatus Cloacimonetes bacterium 4572_55]|nr:MAG: hypothetical protein B6244_05310 [Candidatus Cloacimonetes bacterium 4572_55]
MSCAHFFFVGVPLFFLISSGYTEEWKTTESPHFKFYFKEGERQIVPSIQFAAEKSVKRISNILNYRVTEKTSVFITASPAELDSLAAGKTPEWGVGFALPQKNRIILKSPRYMERLLPLEQIVCHEYAHIVLGRKTGRNSVPRWLNEGLAMYLSREMISRDEFILCQAVILNRLIPYHSLERGFPLSTKQADLAYLQSYFAVSYLVQNIHEIGIQNMLDDYVRHPNMDRILFKHAKIGKPEFYFYCQKRLKREYGWLFLLSQSGLLWGGITLLFIVVFLVKSVRTKHRLKQMEALENQDDPELPN